MSTRTVFSLSTERLSASRLSILEGERRGSRGFSKESFSILGSSHSAFPLSNSWGRYSGPVQHVNLKKLETGTNFSKETAR